MKFWTPSTPTGGRPLRAQVGKTLQHARLKRFSQTAPRRHSYKGSQSMRSMHAGYSWENDDTVSCMIALLWLV